MTVRRVRRKSQDINIVAFLYFGSRNYRPKYCNVLYKRLRQFNSFPFRFTVVYQPDVYDLSQFDSGIELVPMPQEALDLLSVTNICGNDHPSCYSRLILFSDWAKQLGDRVFIRDIDSVPVGDMKPLVEHRADADFVGWCRHPETFAAPWIAGSTWILRTGSLPEVWDDFVADPIKARQESTDWFLARDSSAPEDNPNQVKRGWKGGSDQSWLTHKLLHLVTADGPITTWPEHNGIKLFHQFKKTGQPEPGDILLEFNGAPPRKPWSMDGRQWEWVRELYGNTPIQVVGRSLRYGGKKHPVGEIIQARPADANALVQVRRAVYA